MGTNFYWVGIGGDRMDPKRHIGKRSAAGPYCFDCGITLCKEGNEGVHKSKSGWHDKCPKCGKEPRKEGWDSAGGLELGFAKTTDMKTSGVCSASSFSYAQDPLDVERKIRGKRHVMDEYERRYTAKRFKAEVLDKCPIKFTCSLGTWFS